MSKYQSHPQAYFPPIHVNYLIDVGCTNGLNQLSKDTMFTLKLHSTYYILPEIPSRSIPYYVNIILYSLWLFFSDLIAYISPQREIQNLDSSLKYQRGQHKAAESGEIVTHNSFSVIIHT